MQTKIPTSPFYTQGVLKDAEQPSSPMQSIILLLLLLLLFRVTAPISQQNICHYSLLQSWHYHMVLMLFLAW